jgi:hypothetical protein
VKVRNPTTHKKNGKVEEATRHFIASLSPTEANARRPHRTIRSHWGCESQHWQRDASWGEDKCRLRNPNAACALPSSGPRSKAWSTGSVEEISPPSSKTSRTTSPSDRTGSTNVTSANETENRPILPDAMRKDGDVA